MGPPRRTDPPSCKRARSYRHLPLRSGRRGQQNFHRRRRSIADAAREEVDAKGTEVLAKYVLQAAARRPARHEAPNVESRIADRLCGLPEQLPLIQLPSPAVTLAFD